MLHEDAENVRFLLEANRQVQRGQRRAIILAAVACSLTLGILVGHFLSHDRSHVLAGTHDIPSELASSFVMIAKQVEPSVVNISTVTQPVSSGRDRSGSFENPLPFDFSRPVDKEARRGVGSGVIVDAAGYILTNHHVILGADRIKVKLADGAEYIGKVIGGDQETDLAVVKIEPRVELRSARLGDSDRTQVGDWVLAIGSPFGLDQTVTAGIISAKDREANELKNRPSFQHFLQTDAAINRGNSGGPLINLAGEVVGINAAIATTTGDYNGIGFAVPSNEALLIYRQLNKTGRVVRGFLGVVTDPVTPQIAKVYGLASARGAIVSIVTDSYSANGRDISTPAARAGLQLADILIEYRGEPLRNNLDLIRRVAATPVGSEAEIKIVRNGREMMLRAVIGKRPSIDNDERQEPDAPVARVGETQSLGLDVANLPISLAKEMETNGVIGVVVARVQPGSLAEDVDLRRDDIIERVNRQPVSNALQFRRALEKVAADESIVLQVYRRKSSAPRRFVSLNKP